MGTENSNYHRQIRTDLVPLFLKLVEGSEKQRGAPDFAHADLAEALILDAWHARASDIHLEPFHDGARVRFRIDGVIWDVAHLNPDPARWVRNQFKTMAELDPVTRFVPKDAHARFAHDGHVLNLRLALAPSLGGEVLSVRLLDADRLEKSIQLLGLTSKDLIRLEAWLHNTSGLFLAAGPTGSGKTTTVYSLLRELKLWQNTIITLEDPVEYRIEGITQIQVDELHHLCFPEGVKSMLRLDPDYLMLGEIRDAESAKAAIMAAISGRVLLSTIHSRDAVGVLMLLRNWGVADHEIVEALSVVMVQRLVRTLCSKCRKKARPNDKDVRWFESLGLEVPDRIWEPVGCRECQSMGYKGRTGIFELWRLDESDYRLVLEHSDEHTIKHRLIERGHTTLLDDGLHKVTNGTTSVAELRKMGASDFHRRAKASIAEAKKQLLK